MPTLPTPLATAQGRVGEGLGTAGRLPQGKESLNVGPRCSPLRGLKPDKRCHRWGLTVQRGSADPVLSGRPAVLHDQ